MTTRLGLTLLLLMATQPAHAAVVAATGYAVHTIPTPAPAAGGVVRRGQAILVGQGSFGAGGMQIIRLDGATATTIATGFNSLGGFDLDASGTLYVVDNGGELAGATTGDTLYAIPDALTRTTAVAAAGVAVVPPGTFPAAEDVLIGPGGVPIVSDARGVGAGLVATVSGTTVTNIITGLDFLGALALTADGTLLVNNLDGSFVGSVQKYSLSGTFLGTLANGLSGSFGLAIDADGLVLVSGGFTPDFSSSTIVALDASGTSTERAHGFSFSSDLYFDTARDETLALDFGVSAVTAICRDRDGDGVCDVDDDCPLVADPGQADSDGDGVGDACDPCAATATVDKAAIVINGVTAPAGDETLTLSSQLMVPLTPTIDPVLHGMRVVLAWGGVTHVDATLTGTYTRTSRTGWAANRTHTAWGYVNTQGVQGIVKAAVKTVPSVPGLVKIAVVTKRGDFAVASADLPLSATLSLDPAGQCGEARFPGSGKCWFIKSKLACK
jgi:hypothetical protein